MKQLIDVRRQRVERIAEHIIFQQPDRLYSGYTQRLDQLSYMLLQTMQQRIQNTQHQFMTLIQRQLQLRAHLLQQPRDTVNLLTAKLDLVSPLKILTRGYAIVENQGDVVRKISDINVDDDISVRFSDGMATAKIVEKRALKNE